MKEGGLRHAMAAETGVGPEEICFQKTIAGNFSSPATEDTGWIIPDFLNAIR